MSHDELTDLLQSLPRTSATAGFTARTLARATGSRRPARYLRSAVATVLSAILLLSGAIGLHRHQERIRTQQLRTEQQQLRRELDELKTLATERKPQVFVGSSGSIDLVVGIGPRPPRGTTTSQPVALHISDDATY